MYVFWEPIKDKNVYKCILFWSPWFSFDIDDKRQSYTDQTKNPGIVRPQQKSSPKKSFFVAEKLVKLQNE